MRFIRWCKTSCSICMNLSAKGLRRFVKDEVEIQLTDNNAKVFRKGWRALLDCSPGERDLPRVLAGQIPFFYREPQKIAADFQGRHDVFDTIFDLAIKAPTTPKFQQSHCGEILSALYLEDVLGYKSLYSKLTLTTAENTNVHKMDGFFVDLSTVPITFIAVEAKTSILPTEKTSCSGHRYGILKQLVDSLESYSTEDKRFDFALIRDNLTQERFTEQQRIDIREELKPPGPSSLVHIGIATVNESTLCPKDDQFILTELCKLDFTFRSLVVADLAGLAESAYGHLKKLKL
jgi:hypothetical protein